MLDFLDKYGIGTEDKDSNGLDKKTKRTELFQEVSKLGSKERKKRNFFGANLDPNHSHFIFADDGGLLNFGGETRLRADIESCVAGNFNVVGIDNGSGGRILHRVDEGISRMLETMKQGVPSYFLSLPSPPCALQPSSKVAAYVIPGLPSPFVCHCRGYSSACTTYSLSARLDKSSEVERLMSWLHRSVFAAPYYQVGTALRCWNRLELRWRTRTSGQSEAVINAKGLCGREEERKTSKNVIPVAATPRFRRGWPR